MHKEGGNDSGSGSRQRPAWGGRARGYLSMSAAVGSELCRRWPFFLGRRGLLQAQSRQE